MAELNLTQLDAKHPYIKKIEKSLSTAVKQKIVITEVLKVKRVAGVSAVPVRFVFAGNQTLELFVRASADVFKANLNDKSVALSGDFSDVHDFTFNRGVEGMAKLIREGQKDFESKLSKERVRLPKSATPRASTSPTVKLNQVNEQIVLLDQQLEQKTAIRDELLAKIEQKKQLTSQQ